MFFEDPKTETGKTIKFDGCPYVILGRKVFDCQHGVDRHAKDKKRKQKNAQVRKEAAEVSILNMEQDNGMSLTNFSFQTSKRRGPCFQR